MVENQALDAICRTRVLCIYADHWTYVALEECFSAYLDAISLNRGGALGAQAEAQK